MQKENTKREERNRTDRNPRICITIFVDVVGRRRKGFHVYHKAVEFLGLVLELIYVVRHRRFQTLQIQIQPLELICKRRKKRHRIQFNTNQKHRNERLTIRKNPEKEFSPALEFRPFSCTFQGERKSEGLIDGGALGFFRLQCQMLLLLRTDWGRDYPPPDSTHHKSKLKT